MRGSLALGLVLLALELVGGGSAHAQLAEGRRRLEQADFTRAVRAFDRAERGAHLTRDDLVAIYEGRAMARWAMGDESHAQRDLASLAEIDVAHQFPPEAPPELGAAFASAAREGGLSLEITFTDDSGTCTVNVDARHDGEGLVRSLRTHARVADGAWSTSSTGTATLVVVEGGSVEVWAEAIGPGGAVIATEGSESAPIVHGGGAQRELEGPVRTGPPPEDVIVREPVHEEEHHDDTGLFIGIGVGVGVAVIAAVIIGVVLGTSGPSDHTQPGVPVVRF